MKLQFCSPIHADWCGLCMSSLCEWRVVSTLLLVPGFNGMESNMAIYMDTDTYEHVAVMNQWIWGFQISGKSLSDNLTSTSSTFCRAWIPAISAVSGEAISVAIGSPANKYISPVLCSCFGWFQRRTYSVLRNQMVLQGPVRGQKFIDQTQLRNYVHNDIVQRKGPLDTVYMCLHHHQPIIHHEPSWSKASHKFALAGAESSHYLSLHLVTTGDDPACCFMPARCSLRLRLVLLRRLTSVRICEISAFEAAECDRHKLVNSKIDT